MTPTQERNLKLLCEYTRKHGWKSFDGNTRYYGRNIGQWAAKRRVNYRRGKLAPELIQGLESIPGWSWEPQSDLHHKKAKLLSQFIAVHGWDKFKVGRTTYRGYNIGTWVMRCRYWYRQAELPDYVIDLCERIPGWCWSVR